MLSNASDGSMAPTAWLSPQGSSPSTIATCGPPPSCRGTVSTSCAPKEILLGGIELDLDHAGRTCILLSSHEISRVRGGPHCLTHPLLRDA
ncbi:MAG: hypothetical protein CME06_16185 [Gemmatimonadetes bacterium]|nr:hypothetical protein [Gemmatimonadota bacterium]